MGDEPARDADVKRIWSAIQNPKYEWDVISANSEPTYYDLWPLRTDAYNKDCWADGSACFDDQGLKKWFPHDACVDKERIDANCDHWVPVLGAFNAIGVYKLQKTIGCEYDGEGKAFSDGEQCEHVTLNECMRHRNGAANMFIAPDILLNDKHQKNCVHCGR